MIIQMYTNTWKFEAFLIFNIMLSLMYRSPIAKGPAFHIHPRCRALDIRNVKTLRTATDSYMFSELYPTFFVTDN